MRGIARISVFALFASLILGGCATTLDDWIDERIESLAEKDRRHAEEIREVRLASIAQWAPSRYVVTMGGEDGSEPKSADVDEYHNGWLEDLRQSEKRLVANSSQSEDLLETIARQSSRIYDAETQAEVGRLTGAQALVRLEYSTNYSPTLPTPKDVKPSGAFRYRTVTFTASCLDLATGRVIFEESTETMTLAGPGR